MTSKKMQDAGKNPQALYALIISMISVSLSGLALWLSVLAPADITVSLGNPEFQYDAVGDRKPEVLGGSVATPASALGLVATCAFANNGATAGEISEIAIQFVSDNGTRWFFTPYRLLDDAPRITDANGRTSIEWGKAPHFSPIVLPGKQTARHTFLFLGDEFDKLAPHTFHVKLFTWSGSKSEPREQQVSTLDFNQLVVATVASGTMTDVPFEETRQQMRRFLKAK